MSRLEVSAQAVLKPLMSASRGVAQLSPTDRFTLARWTTKTAFVLNSASNFGQHVPLEHYSLLRTDPRSLPRGLAVFAQLHDGNIPFYWVQGAVWQVQGHDLEDLERLTETTYKISLLFGRLMLLVAWWPHPGWRLTLCRGIHVPMWPARGPVAFYDANDFPWDEAERAIATFHVGLRLLQEPHV